MEKTSNQIINAIKISLTGKKKNETGIANQIVKKTWKT
jgi:hypothetical protein